jgi:hypothetical protein
LVSGVGELEGEGGCAHVAGAVEGGHDRVGLDAEAFAEGADERDGRLVETDEAEFVRVGVLFLQPLCGAGVDAEEGGEDLLGVEVQPRRATGPWWV